LAAGGQNEQDCLDDLAQINLSRAAQSTPTRQLPGYQMPLRVGHVACIAEAFPQILSTSDFGPWHGALPRIFANPKESQPTEITHSFFGQALRPFWSPHAEAMNFSGMGRAEHSATLASHRIPRAFDAIALNTGQRDGLAFPAS
jgi:hypothetical protein